MSKIDDLAVELRKMLNSGYYPPGARFPSEYELMERFHVARLTANKAVAMLAAEGLLERGRRGSGTFVRQERKYPGGWIAMLADMTHPYNAKIVAGASYAALSDDYMISIFNPGINELAETLQKIAHSDCIGVLTMGYGLLPENFPKPVIYLDGGIDKEKDGWRHNITCDNYGAGLEMMTRVLESGCREVVTVSMPDRIHRRRRLEGFEDAMRKFELDKIEQRNYFVQDSHSVYEMLQIMRSVLKNFPEVGYIVTDSDDIVLRIMEVSKIDKIDCPGRIKLTGFGNVYGVADIHHLPTVDQHPWHIGLEAVNSMFKLVNNENITLPINIQVPAEVINTQFI